MSEIAIVTATRMEAKAARKALPGIRVIEAGIALCHRDPLVLSLSKDVEGQPILISCGLAGGLHDHLPTGTVVIPNEVLRPDGTMLTCDTELTGKLVSAARARGIKVVTDPIVTTTRIITRDDRRVWSARGYAGVDMETGLLDAPRVAAVRVLLDTPLRELSEEWLHPMRALLDPRLWPEALWLARHAPRCAALAAETVKLIL